MKKKSVDECFISHAVDLCVYHVLTRLDAKNRHLHVGWTIFLILRAGYVCRTNW